MSGFHTSAERRQKRIATLSSTGLADALLIDSKDSRRQAVGDYLFFFEQQIQENRGEIYVLQPRSLASGLPFIINGEQVQAVGGFLGNQPVVYEDDLMHIPSESIVSVPEHGTRYKKVGSGEPGYYTLTEEGAAAKEGVLRVGAEFFQASPVFSPPIDVRHKLTPLFRSMGHDMGYRGVD
ncbi:MAG: hypothetical protein OXR66_04300 [Candidatus Woesearchaeota archaeon]|nr:hypothetical protein [Candidatus Woesearchaeota archaeon]